MRQEAGTSRAAARPVTLLSTATATIRRAQAPIQTCF
jgi:hypothetical protein